MEENHHEENLSKATQGTNYLNPSLESFIRGCEKNAIPYFSSAGFQVERRMNVLCECDELDCVGYEVKICVILSWTII